CFGEEGATERAFARAEHIIEMEFPVGRVTGVPMEPRAALGHWDAATGRGTLWAGSGGAVRQKTELSAAVGHDPRILMAVDSRHQRSARGRPGGVPRELSRELPWAVRSASRYRS